MSDIKSVLRLNELVFDKIEFNRQGFKNKNKIKYRFEALFAKNEEENVYRVTLDLTGDKEDEYKFEISITGFFSLNEDGLDEAAKNALISKNTVAILMPYLRSEVSLLTAQPGMDCVVLPPFNINKMIEEENATEE